MPKARVDVAGPCWGSDMGGDLRSDVEHQIEPATLCPLVDTHSLSSHMEIHSSWPQDSLHVVYIYGIGVKIHSMPRYNSSRLTFS